MNKRSVFFCFWPNVVVDCSNQRRRTHWAAESCFSIFLIPPKRRRMRWSKGVGLTIALLSLVSHNTLGWCTEGNESAGCKYTSYKKEKKRDKQTGVGNVRVQWQFKTCFGVSFLHSPNIRLSFLNVHIPPLFFGTNKINILHAIFSCFICTGPYQRKKKKRKDQTMFFILQC